MKFVIDDYKNVSLNTTCTLKLLYHDFHYFSNQPDHTK